LVLAILASTQIFAQTVIVDYEGADATSFGYFGDLSDPSQNDTFAPVIDNPNASGINTSAKVSEFIKPAMAEPWAGGYLPVDTEMNFVLNSEICIDVHCPAIMNIAVKLENSSNGGENWIYAKENTVVNEWEQICYDVTQEAIEAPTTPASGFIYNQVVVFFGFQSPGDGTAYTSYIDNIVTQGSSATGGDITFSVDMNDYADSFTTPFVSGGFNGWSADANPMSDDDLDGVWEATINIADPGQQQYKIQLDGWTAQEMFNGGFDCAITTDDTNWNRVITVNGDATLPTHCFNSCYACGQAVNITFNVGIGDVPAAPEGLQIAGGGNFGVPGDNPMTNLGNCQYTITMEKEIGFSSYYTFANGACPDFSCKEDIAGQDCSDPANFDDRFLEPVMEDIVINTCYGICSDTNDDCGACSDASPGMITLSVDRNASDDPSVPMFMAGSFNGWNATADGGNPMDDTDGDGVWTITIELPAGQTQYKFVGQDFAPDETLTEGDPCTITDGGFTNRLIDVNGDATIPTVCHGTCDICEVSTNDLVIDNTFFNVYPTIVTSEFVIDFETANLDANVDVYDAFGKNVSTITNVMNDRVNVNTSDLASGIYFVTVKTENKQGVQRIIVTK